MEKIVSPSILSADFANLERDVKLVFNCGAKWVHIDVMDGHFVPNITIGAPVVKSLRPVAEAIIDVHLMIDDPIKYIPDFIEAGSDFITFHIEAAKENTMDCIKLIKNANLMTGISVKPGTPACVIEKYIEYIDMVLIMTVEPGFSGQSFMLDAAKKIGQVRDFALKLGKKDLIIQVDGGINEKTAKICSDLGANCFVAGNYVFKSIDIKSAIQNLLKV